MDWEGCDAVESRPDKMSGAAGFVGTRIPGSTLFENLKAGATIDEFLEWFPGSDRSQIEEVLDFVAGTEQAA
ncbi:MAG: DUF433 domain-containing protein [Verrucomicrobiales bacterium]